MIEVAARDEERIGRQLFQRDTRAASARRLPRKSVWRQPPENLSEDEQLLERFFRCVIGRVGVTLRREKPFQPLRRVEAR